MHYHTHLYRALAADSRFLFTAIFASSGGVRQHDAGFGAPVAWDSDIVGGYNYRFLKHADCTPISGGFFDQRGFDIYSDFSKIRPEVVWLHGYNYLLNQHVLYKSASQRIPVLIRDDQTLLNDRARWKQIAKHLGLRATLRLAHPLYVGNANKSWYLHYGASLEKMHYAPYSVDNRQLIEQSNFLTPSKSLLRKRFGIDNSTDPVIVIVGRLIPEKQHILLIEAYSSIRKHLKCHLLIVGSGPLDNEIRAAVVRYSAPDVHFAGFLNQSEVGSAYAASDILVLPSFSETWGFVINEGMNFGLPAVVSNRVGCAGELVVDGKSGFVVPFDDAKSLADKLASLVRDSNLRMSMGLVASRHVQAWSTEASLLGIADAVKSSVGRRRWEAALT